MILLMFYFLNLAQDYLLLFMLMEFYSLWMIWVLISSKNSKNSKNWNLLLYYFIYSAISGMIIMMCLMLYLLSYNLHLLELVMTMAFNMKLGIMPFHMMYVLLYSYLNYNNLLVLNMAPKMFMLIMIHKLSLLVNKFFLLSNIINYLLITFNNLYTNNFKKMLMLSSFTNLSLMMMYAMYNYNTYSYMWFMLLLYILNNMPMFKLQPYFFNPLSNMFIIINMLSFMGMPPLIGFLYKFLMMKDTFTLLMLTLMLINSILSMFYYFKFVKFYNDLDNKNMTMNINYYVVLITLFNMFMFILI